MFSHVFLFLRAEKTNFLAIPSAPPISSTIISTFLSLVISIGFFTHLDFGIFIFLFLFRLLEEIYLIFGITPVLKDMFF